MTYGMTFVEKPTEFDCVLEMDGMNVYVDSVALGYLEGVEIDFRDEGVNKSFVFKNVLVRFPWSKDYKGKDFDKKSFSS